MLVNFFCSSEDVFIHYLNVFRPDKYFDKVFKNLNFGRFFGLILSIRLICGSTYAYALWVGMVP